MTRRRQIAVIGASDADARLSEIAEEAGRRIAEAGAVLVTGGLGGVMEAASRGASSAGGLVVGVLPGYDRAEANAHVDVAVATGMGHGRNVIVAASADAAIAVGGGAGTLSEIAFALKLGIPVVSVGSWAIPGVRPAASAAEAVSIALKAAAASA